MLGGLIVEELEGGGLLSVATLLGVLEQLVGSAGLLIALSAQILVGFLLLPSLQLFLPALADAAMILNGKGCVDDGVVLLNAVDDHSHEGVQRINVLFVGRHAFLACFDGGDPWIQRALHGEHGSTLEAFRNCDHGRYFDLVGVGAGAHRKPRHEVNALGDLVVGHVVACRPDTEEYAIDAESCLREDIVWQDCIFNIALNQSHDGLLHGVELVLAAGEEPRGVPHQHVLEHGDDDLPLVVVGGVPLLLDASGDLLPFQLQLLKTNFF